MDLELDLQTQRASSWGWVTRQGPRTESGTEYKPHYPKYSEVLMNKIIGGNRYDFNRCLQSLKPKE